MPRGKFPIHKWQQWRIPLLTFVRNNVDIGAIKRMYLGVGDPRNPKPGGTGTIYIDDIMLTKRTPQGDTGDE